MATITNLSCHYRTNPLGIDILQPHLGWQMQTDRQGARQMAYQILVSSQLDSLLKGVADFWDSGKVVSDRSIHIPYAGRPLTSSQRLYWKVLVWDEDNNLITSDSAWFEMGLLNPTEWQAEWIGAELLGGPRSTIPAPYLRKAFSLANEVVLARLYITALGFYECSINGQLISTDVFTPGWTDYSKHIQYQVYDVTALLGTGENVMGAILGDGWAVGHIGWVNRQQYCDRPRLLAQLELFLADGSCQKVVTDGSWRYQFGPLLENDLLMGEAYDARLEMHGWNTSMFDDHLWHPAKVFEAQPGKLVATNGPTIKRMEERKPVSEPTNLSNFDRPHYIFDMGQNMVGRVRLTGSAPRGTTITLHFAEILDEDGLLYTANLRRARATDYYTFNGEGEETWEPKFTFHGFRYVELLDYPGNVTQDTLTGIVLYSDMAQIGDFECSDTLINQLQSNILWSQKGNFIDVPTDCPQRDERLGWTGDIQVFLRTAAFNMDVKGFMLKWVQDVADAQSEKGEIPPIVPKIATQFMDDGGPAWADAVIICPWTLYQCYGDLGFLDTTYPLMTRFMDFLLATSKEFIRCAPDYEGWLGFGDWLSINADTPRDLIGTAFLAYDANLMAKIAELLGKPGESARYRDLFEQIKAAFAARYLIGSQVTAEAEVAIRRTNVEHANAVSRGNLQVVDYGLIPSQVFNIKLFSPTQTAYVLALHFDLLPQELRPLAVQELVADIEQRNMHLSTGFVGSPYLSQVLSNNGRLDIAYALLNQKTWPSWLYPVTQGATTTWERWDGWTANNGFQSPKMNSFNHYAYGAIGAWLYSVVGGIEIDPAQPGYKHIIFRPQPSGGLTYARTQLQSPYGKIISDWKIEGDTFTYSVVVPPNTTATVNLPIDGTTFLNGKVVFGQVHLVRAGRHDFVVR